MDWTGYFEANRLNWDERAPVHAASDMYGLERYRTDPAHVGGVVGFDRDRLGDLSGKSAVHLQCHIGTDTLGLARLGARVAGVDQSEISVATARQLFADAGVEGRFEVTNLYDAPEVLGERYDLVYTGVGAINWLPDIVRWAGVVADLLAPGGVLYLREGHPVMWSLDERVEDALQIGYPYFETAEPMAFDETETYTDGDVHFLNTRTYEWNHGLGEILTAVLDHGLVIDTFEEHRFLEWPFHPQMVERDGAWVLPGELADRVPLMYTLVARLTD